VTAEGILIVTGRTGEFINSGGVKVSPRVIEDVLLAQPGVTQAAAFGVPDQHGLAQIWAAVVVEPGTDTGAVARAAGAALGVKAPRALIQVPDLPRNANGKVLVHELVAQAARLYRR
jgi:O-succinylbenzoic acid--CoA ligase